MKPEDASDFVKEVTDLRELLYKRALWLEGTPAAAEDLAQDTVERGLRAFGRLSTGSNVRAWLLTIMNNAFVDRVRHRAQERLTEPGNLAGVSQPEPEPLPLWRIVHSEDLGAAVASLPPGLREIFDLHKTGVYSYRQLAERLGITTNTVGTRLLRARRQVRRLLERGVASAGPTSDDLPSRC
jgi:RNA polymerase sigma-70 factor (ECF subfamily)